MLKGDAGAVVYATTRQGFTHFVQRHPLPEEVDVSKVSFLADSGDRDQFPAGGWNAEITGNCCGIGNQVAERAYTEGSQGYVPARWRSHVGRARHVYTGDPAAMLQHQVLGRKVVFVGNDAGSKPELLLGAKTVGVANDVGG